MIGKTLQNGKYEIRRILGQGGFGITYEGVQTALGRKVAIKVFFMKDFCERDEGTSHVTLVGTEGNRNLVKRFMEKFIKEAQMIAGLEDVPHIIRIYDIFQENGTAYYVMQFIEGGSLDDLVKKKGALSEGATFGYVRQIAEALGNLHKQRIMHLDIKPANILLRGEELFLIDFGVSKHYDAEGDATTTTPVGRSKGYAPIEQYRQGGVLAFSPETDIYSLGATTYFLVTGHTPPEATELVVEPLKRPNGLSDGLWNAINAAMSPNKNNRPHSIAEFMELLENRSERSTEREDVKEETTTIDFGGTTTKLNAEAIQNESPSELKFSVTGNGKTVSFKMIKVEAGSFQMGSINGYGGKPVHQVTISKDYYMGETEVTQNLWVAVMGNNPSKFKGRNKPVENVCYKDCQEFIRKLNQITGKNFRLPTEAEWEYAARGGNESRVYTYAGSDYIDEVAWCVKNSYDKGSNSPDYGTHPVAQKLPNELGLYDMSGNVWEWCYDWYGSYSSSARIDPIGPSSGTERVVRGGCWRGTEGSCRSTNRCRFYYYSEFSTLGFRLAL